MPSVSAKQHRFFEFVAHTPGASKSTGVPRSLAKEFLTADRGKTFKKSTSYKVAKVKKGKQTNGLKKDLKADTA